VRPAKSCVDERSRARPRRSALTDFERAPRIARCPSTEPDSSARNHPAEPRIDALITTLLIVALFALLGSGVWIGLALSGVAWIGMTLFSSRPAGDAMAVTVWGTASSWTLTALPLFVWMGEILFRTRLSEDMFKGLAPWLERVPGRLLHTNIIGCTIFAAVSGSSAATCATIGKMTLPELKQRGYPDDITIGTLAGAGTLGLLIPPSIIMIVYGVTANVSIAQLFIAGVLPGVLLAALFSGYIVCWALLHPDRVPAATERTSFAQKFHASRHLIPVVLLIALVLGSIYTGLATATEAAAFGVVGSLALSAAQRSLDWSSFRAALLGATRLYCMIALILAGAAFLTLAMGYIGLPRELAEWIGSLGLTPFALIIALALFYIVLGCFLDGISMVVLTMGVILPTVEKAGIDLLWFGIFIVVVVEMAQITPPVGFNLFVLQGMTKKQITWIAKQALPMFLLMCIAVFAIWYFPSLVTLLPRHMKL
jgi:tripartite ATP-independent transporter DctM subunit